MITADEINKMLKDYIKSEEGEKYIEHEISTNPDIVRDYEEAVRTLARLIYTHAPLQIRGSLDPGMIMNWASRPIKIGDEYTISINFQENLFKRPSLSKNSDGAYNIVSLFIKGWKPKHFNNNKGKTPWRVVGPWRDHGLSPGQAQGYASENLSSEYVISRVEKKADNFIVDAVNEFMAVYAKEYGVVDCVIDERYIAD